VGAAALAAITHYDWAPMAKRSVGRGRSRRPGNGHNGSVTGQLSRLPLRGEDLGLAAWNLVSLPIGVALAGSWSSSERDPLVGIIEVLALLGVIVAIGTRTAGIPPIQAESFRGWIIAGPLIGAAGFIGSNATDRLGIDLGPLGAVLLLTIVGAFVFADRLPVLPELHRRLLTAPFILLTAAFFSDFMTGILDGIDLVDLARSVFSGASSAPGQLVVAAFLGFALLAASAVFYAMLIVAPRELAAPEPNPGVWVSRFVVFVVSAAIGAGGWLLL
jgi:hypothetical protein